MAELDKDDLNLDDLAAVNRARWNALVDANVQYTQPFLDFTSDQARAWLDPGGIMGDVTGQDVLCLAAGGGQQSILFAQLGANVTVTDLSDNQLARDRTAAAQLGLAINIVHADMRDLRAFADASFDLVYHAFSITFVPDIAPVIDEVTRVLRPGGRYRVQWHNPFVQGIDPWEDWTGTGYLLHRPYLDGYEMSQDFPHWDVEGPDGQTHRLDSPREFRHSLRTMINTLGAHNLLVYHAWEDTSSEPNPEPGTWEHYKHFAPPYLTLWARYLPVWDG